MIDFCIRDDDVNFYTDPQKLINGYSGVIGQIPISFFCIPFVYNGWDHDLLYDEKKGPYLLDSTVRATKLTNLSYEALANNYDLVCYIKSLIKTRLASVSMHGIHHLNTDPCLDPALVNTINNFPHKAEFYTNQDQSLFVDISKSYLENVFDSQVSFISFPQNLYNRKGVYSALHSGLNICAPLPAIKSLWTLSNLRPNEYLRLCGHRIMGVQEHISLLSITLKNGLIWQGSFSLQPSTCLQDAISALDLCRDYGIRFVLSTHYYVFCDSPSWESSSMRDKLFRIIEYASSKSDVRFSLI